MTEYRILGVMSGSSLDGLDMGIVAFSINQEGELQEWKLEACASKPIIPELRSRLSKTDFTDSHEILSLDVAVGEFIGGTCAGFIESTGQLPDAIASHGHTLVHRPSEGYTLQVGNPARIARITGCRVISHFRDADIAAGGQGAPLAPLAEKYLFPGFRFYLNLGGIANLTCIDDRKKIRAWDVAPCNQLLNFVSGQSGLSYDDRGQLASRGHVDSSLLDSLKSGLTLPLAEPLSMDNGWIRRQFLPLLKDHGISMPDKLATLVEFIADSIVAQMKHCGIGEGVRLMATGGGVHNDFLITQIRGKAQSCDIVIPAGDIIDFKEAILMAFCGLRRLQGQPNAFGSVTGAATDTVNGVVTYGRRTNYS